jgi:hypothetical protein
MLKTRAGLTVRRFVAPRHRRGRLPFFGWFRAQMSGISWRYLGYLVVQVAAVSIVLNGCSRPVQTPPVVTEAPAATSVNATEPPLADAPPAALVRVGESAEGLFDAAAASNWLTATEQVQALSEAASQLPPHLPKADLVAQLRTRIDDVKQSAAARRRVETMDFANSITRIIADLSAEFQTDVPIDVVMLDYYGRQLELGIATGRQSTLTQATADLRQQWNRIEPTIERRGHVDEARRFKDIVVQLEGARRPADFAAPTRAELVAVDRLERIFRPTR